MKIVCYRISSVRYNKIEAMILDNHFNAWPKTVKFQHCMINGWNQVILFHYNVSAGPLSLPFHGNGRHRLSFGHNNTREITQYTYILHKYLSIITPLWTTSSMLIMWRSKIFTMIWIKLEYFRWKNLRKCTPICIWEIVR